MATPDSRPTERFSDRVDAYVRYRPSYPAAILEQLGARGALGPTVAVADIGAGTGIFTRLLLPHSRCVYAIEPNAAMRRAAEEALGDQAGFISVAGSAEATTLPDRSVDLVTAAQAFHWFDADRCRREFQRILRPGGYVALIWNERQLESTPFLAAYEQLLRRHATDYAAVNHLNVGTSYLQRFFGPGGFDTFTAAYEQSFDYPSLLGRLLSSSYAPAPGHPGHDAMVAELQELFHQHAVGGRVSFLYDTRLHLGRLS